MKALFFVDGYNIIFAWDSLKTLAHWSLEHARQRLIDMMAAYGKIKGVELVLVFDAMHNDEAAKEEQIGKECTVIYTDKEEMADSCIERLVYAHKGDGRSIYVATSDGTEQNQILGSGACRVPARELAEDVARMNREAQRYGHDNSRLETRNRNEVANHVRNRDVWEKLEKLRRSK